MTKRINEQNSYLMCFCYMIPTQQRKYNNSSYTSYKLALTANKDFKLEV